MAKRVWLVGLAGVLVFSLSGCSTTRKSKDLEIQGLRNQVSALESQGSVKDEGASNVSESSQNSGELSSQPTERISEAKQRPNAKQIQVALKNAGYYQGVIDGKLGRVSREAIRAFQKANNLSVDGKVGKKTWAALKDYLEKKVK